MQPSEVNPRTAAPELAAVVGEVLGDLAFLVSDDERAEARPGAVWMECSISYSGPFGGTLRCWCTRDFAVQLAANLLGLGTEDDAALEGTRDALCEFMNVVCGQYVTARHGTDPVFNLSIPVAVECAEAPSLDTDEGAHVCALSVSGEPFYCAYERRST